jgi:hypothetical protein
MPRATTGRQDTPLVQLSGDSSHAGDPLGSQVIQKWPREIGVTDEHRSPNHAWRHTFKLSVGALKLVVLF